jgi:hypothetical protein
MRGFQADQFEASNGSPPVVFGTYHVPLAYTWRPFR